MVGVIDLFTTSNSDCGMSGSITPFVQLYDGFFFTPNGEPCKARYLFEKSLYEEDGIDRGLKLDTFEDYIECITKLNEFENYLAYEKIQIIEKDVSEPSKSSKSKDDNKDFADSLLDELDDSESDSDE